MVVDELTFLVKMCLDQAYKVLPTLVKIHITLEFKHVHI